MEFPEDRHYTKEHEWIKVEADGVSATIGITEFAQGELGDVVFVELSPVGTSLAADEAFGTVEAVKTVSDLFIPVAGTITEINEDLDATPEIVNESPYSEGWMVKVTLDDSDSVKALMSAAEYAEMVGS